ncbi:hypothetical protein JY651_39985 [Pyxidicoccus parkwayensis]|uniref:Uncharacterized protein n=1 Tax=Pyxidicoccus parkwayensis TaxID=2813578 RepID=A0ABX7NV09_9BACT|nr:hypothetical protein [Pyxidicoccus parkwaysis]QSQ21307.1 hypothetical protein JY651_39985 [Pyxidicoccus parkwaysis]
MRPQHPERRVDTDGVTHVAPARSSSSVGLWLVGGALVFTAVCIGLSVWWSHSDVEVEPLPLVEAPPASVVQPPPMVAQAPVQRPRPAAPVATPAPVVVEETVVPPAEPEPYTGPTGTQLYRPGTKPLKRGIVVPEDFELPPGYVRHYQSTDDGDRLKAILMFHPDYEPKDASGQPIPLPENRVVPAEMAPPGLPIQMLELPEGSEAGAAQ